MDVNDRSVGADDVNLTTSNVGLAHQATIKKAGDFALLVIPV